MKISKTQKRERLDFTESLLVDLYSTREIIAMLRDRFGIGHRAAEYYIADVQKRWLAESTAKREAKIAEIEHTTNAVIRDARASQNYGAAVAALGLKAKLHGLASKAIEHTGSLELNHHAKVVMMPPLETDETGNTVETKPGTADKVPVK